jgi:phospholipid/cholesterol/gamma-HCH transport system permease protein
MTVRSILQLLVLVLRGIGGTDPKAAFKEAYELANRSAFFVAVVMGCVGVIMTVQSAEQSLRMIGDLALIGPTFLQLLVRELAPAIVALMVAARYGAGAAAQIGTMQITEQIDALRMAGAEPVRVLVMPRFVGGLVGMPVLVISMGALSFVAGAVAARTGFGVSYLTFFNARMLELSDVLVGVAKAVAFGGAVPIVACASGFAARGGAPGVGRATTSAVIGGSLAVLFLDLVIGAVGQAVVMSTRV